MAKSSSDDKSEASGKKPPKDDFLSEKNRAEDILLGALGFGEEAVLVSVEQTEDGYRGTAKFDDGVEFPFESDYELDDLDRWALSVLAEKS